MKTWMTWSLLIVGIAAIILLSWWLTSTLSFWVCNTIVIVVNFIAGCYIILQKKPRKKIIKGEDGDIFDGWTIFKLDDPSEYNLRRVDTGMGGDYGWYDL